MPDPFATFNLPPAFELDLDDLRQKFLTASAEHHPDRFTDPLDQADAVERSAALNDAYQTLVDPEARANALFALRGGPAASDDKSLPPMLLMEMMEVREELEQALADDDTSTLDRLRGWANQQQQNHIAELGRHFAKDDLDGKAVRLELNAMRYIQRMLEQLPS